MVVPGRAAGLRRESAAAILACVLSLLYDVHGNLPALEAVLRDAEGQGADSWLLGGDYALFGGWPAETVARLETLRPATWIRGNGERWTGDPGAVAQQATLLAAVADCRAALGDAAVGRLAALPFDARVDGARFVHASPVSDVRSFAPEPDPEEDARLLADAAADRLVFGHTHVAFARTAADGTELVNPGSVGMPTDGDHRASYALLHDDGRVEHRRVAYDHALSAARVRERGEWAEVAARRIERAAM